MNGDAPQENFRKIRFYIQLDWHGFPVKLISTFCLDSLGNLFARGENGLSEEPKNLMESQILPPYEAPKYQTDLTDL